MLLTLIGKIIYDVYKYRLFFDLMGVQPKLICIQGFANCHRQIMCHG